MKPLTSSAPDGEIEGRECIAVRVSEAARLLSLSRSKAYQLINSGELPAVRIGKTMRVPLAALRDWVERMQKQEGSTDGTTSAR
jgi:excisionase family DNA binding protein